MSFGSPAHCAGLKNLLCFQRGSQQQVLRFAQDDTHNAFFSILSISILSNRADHGLRDLRLLAAEGQ